MPQPISIGFFAAWLLVGAAVAGWASQRHPVTPGWLVASVVAWPLLLPALQPRPARGPLADRVDAALRRLRDAAVDLPHLLTPDALDEIDAAVQLAVARVRRLDDLRAATGDGPAVDALTRARDDAAAALAAHLDALDGVAVQAGLLAVGADAGPIGERLADLRARLSAHGEVASLRERPPPP